jgi:hypothetical protein
MKLAIVLLTSLAGLGLSSPVQAERALLETRADCSFKSLDMAKSALAKNDILAASKYLAELHKDMRFCPSAAGKHRNEVRKLDELLKKEKAAAPRKQIGLWDCPAWAPAASSDCRWTGTHKQDHPKPACRGKWVPKMVRVGTVEWVCSV